MLTLKIPQVSADGSPEPEMEVEVEFGSPIFILGVNGSGKSALLYHLAQKLEASGEKIKLLTGGRQLWMPTSLLDTSSSNRAGLGKQREGDNLKQQERTQDSVRDGFPGAVLHQLADSENEMAREIMYSLIAGAGQVIKDDVLPKENPPFQRLNELLRAAGFPFSIEITKGRAAVQAVRESHTLSRYGIADMSDGERSAILTAAEILSAPQGATFIIDEPERHLHPAVSVPFLSSLFAARTDCRFLVATNQLDLPRFARGSKSLVLRSCIWERNKVQGWDAMALDRATDLDEDLKRAIMGARKKALFVEGENQSLDMPLYRALFNDPELSIIPLGSYKDVVGAVDGLRKSEAHHDVKAFGLIDGDGWRRPNALAERGIYALNCYSVESLYYCEASIASVARGQSDNLSIAPEDTRYDADKMIAAAKDEAIAVLGKNGLPEVMAAKLCAQHTSAQIDKRKPKEEDIRINHGATEDIKVETGYKDELARYKRALAEGDFGSLVARYPLKSTNVFQPIAKKLHYNNREDYESAVVNRVRKDNDLAESLKRQLGGLAEAISKWT